MEVAADMHMLGVSSKKRIISLQRRIQVKLPVAQNKQEYSALYEVQMNDSTETRV